MSRGRWGVAGATGLLVAAVLLALALTRPGSGPPAGPPAGGIGTIGVNVNRIFNERIYSPAQEAALVRALAATGVDTGRSDTLWELTEPRPPQRGVHGFDWRFDDGIAGTLAAAGLRWQPIVDYSAGWARARFDLLHSPPGDPASYAAFTGALAHRYGPGGSFWAEHPGLPRRPVRTYEIWNEPDSPTFWSPAPIPAAYARLYGAARTAIHAVDPTAVVLVGGLTRPVSYLPELLAADPALRGAIDGVAIHPYANTTAAVLGLVKRARTALRGLGLGSVPLVLSEFGWVTSPVTSRHYVPAGSRPGLVRATVSALAHTDCSVAGEIVYTWVTPRRDPANEEDWYGLEPPGGGPSADANALALGARQARAPGPLEHVCG